MAQDSVAGAWIPDVSQRWKEIESEIDSKGTYTHTKRELQFGSRLAWRNSNRCIGRHFWRTLQVIDARDCTTETQAIDHLKRHVDAAFNGGKITNVITVFPPAQTSQDPPWRMLNHQLVRYAGFGEDQRNVKGTPTAWHSPHTVNVKAGTEKKVRGRPCLGSWSKTAKSSPQSTPFTTENCFHTKWSSLIPIFPRLKIWV